MLGGGAVSGWSLGWVWRTAIENILLTVEQQEDADWFPQSLQSGGRFQPER